MCWLKRTPISTSRAIAARTSSRTSGAQLVPGPADVAPGEGQQPGPFAAQRGRLVGGRELGDSGGDGGVERQVDEPPLEPFLGGVTGCPDVGGGVDVGHERGAADGVGDHAAGRVERGQGVGVRAGSSRGRSRRPRERSPPRAPGSPPPRRARGLPQQDRSSPRRRYWHGPRIERAQNSVSPTEWIARPASPPTTVPLMRMNCRSRPTCSSMRRDVSALSQRSTVVAMRSATSPR